MRKQIQQVVIILNTITLSTLLLFSLPAFAQNTPSDNEENPLPENALPLKDLRLFTLIFDHIRRSYVEPISDKELLENAIKGMLQEMDPHSAYLDASTFKQVQRNTHGQFSGVGIEIGSEGGFIKVISPIDGTPAQKAGLLAGDVIIKLDQESTQGMSLNEASSRIRGPSGSDITFTIVRKGASEPFDIVVTRGTISTSSVRHEIIDDSIGYIRIAQFHSSTGSDFRKSLAQLQADQPELSGLILDLRNNPGGLLQASVQVVDSFIHSGTIVSTKGRLETSNTLFEATEGDDTGGLATVVLVNGGSASASEIVAGALQDQKRAIIMGTQTFGKGSVQTILPVGEEIGIKLTTARYFTPKGRSIQAQGITPDIIVEPATITALKTTSRITEADLGGHLKNSDTDERESSSNKDKKTTDNTKDNQLFEAINLLKGLAILSQQNVDNKSP